MYVPRRSNLSLLVMGSQKIEGDLKQSKPEKFLVRDKFEELRPYEVKPDADNHFSFSFSCVVTVVLYGRALLSVAVRPTRWSWKTVSHLVSPYLFPSPPPLYSTRHSYLWSLFPTTTRPPYPIRQVFLFYLLCTPVYFTVSVRRFIFIITIHFK